MLFLISWIHTPVVFVTFALDKASETHLFKKDQKAGATDKSKLQMAQAWSQRKGCVHWPWGVWRERQNQGAKRCHRPWVNGSSSLPMFLTDLIRDRVLTKQPEFLELDSSASAGSKPELISGWQRGNFFVEILKQWNSWEFGWVPEEATFFLFLR